MVNPWFIAVASVILRHSNHTRPEKKVIKKLLWKLMALTALSALPATLLHAQIGQVDDTWNGDKALDPSITRTYVPLGSGVPGLLYQPVQPGAKSRIAVVVMHGGDYLTFPACTELSKRGYRVLCANPSGAGDGPLLSVKLAVNYARKYPGVEKVVLFGHSGGGVLMSTYQNIAENGLKACQGPEKLYKCSDSVAALPAADGLLLEDANWGIMGLLSLDPAVIDYHDGMKTDPSLDLFNPKNGFKAGGNSDYSQDFIHRFQSALARKYNALVSEAQQRLALIEAGKGHFKDDEPFPIASGGSMVPNNKLFAQDVKLMSHTKAAWPLIHADGSVTTEIVHTVRIPQNFEPVTEYLGMSGSNGTVRAFLRSAVRVADDFSYDETSIHGVDWRSNYTNPIGNSEGIHVPLLFVGNTGHWEYLVGEGVYEHAASKDKSLAFMEGAAHPLNTCTPCEKTPGQYGDTIKPLFDYIDRWLSGNGRFSGGARP